MRNVNMPGFTAEASLAENGGYYEAASKGSTKQTVIAQLARRRPELDCIPGCICVSPINCPCCTDISIPTDPSTGGPFGGGIFGLRRMFI